MQAIKNYFSDWNLFEKVWLLVSTLIIIGVGIAFDDNWVGYVASLTGLWCVVLVAKGKIENYYFGIVNLLAYAYISYNAVLYGEAMLNIVFYLPIQFIGLYLWSRKGNKTEKYVKAKRLEKYQWGALILGFLIFSVLYANFLGNIGGQQVTIDSFAVVLSVFAQILMILRYAEQWLLWIVVNVLTIVLWANVFFTVGDSVTVLVMWIAYLVNSIYGYINWLKLEKKAGL